MQFAVQLVESVNNWAKVSLLDIDLANWKMSLYTSYLRTVDNPLHDRSSCADWLLPEHVRCFRGCFDSAEAYSTGLFSDPNMVARRTTPLVASTSSLAWR